ncbi:MAG: hypothetical protein RIS84_216 [Pseudomonadota bacterium]
MKGQLLFAGVLVASITGCSTQRYIPLAAPFPTTTQPRMAAAHHWDVLAENVADRLKDTLDRIFTNAVVKPPIYIRYTKNEEETDFGRIYYSFLRAELARKGLTVLTNNDRNTLILDYGVQILHHKERAATPSSSQDETGTEVVINTTVTYGTQHIFDDAQMFYINTEDEDQYRRSGRRFAVVNCQQQSSCQ